jgi:hypothetical protein
MAVPIFFVIAGLGLGITSNSYMLLVSSHALENTSIGAITGITAEVCSLCANGITTLMIAFQA